MNISEPFIKRPVATSLLMISIVLLGLFGFRLMPVAALPEISYPTIQVATYYPGASPKVMMSYITAPLEKQFGQMSGLSSMASSSSLGSSLITLQFNLQMDIDVAQQEVQAAINVATAYLPSDLPQPPVYNKVNPADTPIITLSLTSDTLALHDIEDFAETRMVPKISQLSGVGLVNISGGNRPAVRIHVNPTSLAAAQLNLENVHTTVGNYNVNGPKGSFDGPLLTYTLGTNDVLYKAQDYKNIILQYSNNSPLRIDNVAIVEDGVENTYQAAWVNKQKAIILNIRRQPGSNVISVVESVKALLGDLSLPQNLTVTVLTDRTESIRASIADVEFELMVSILLVVAVIFVFLRTFTATIIPAIAVPVSLIGSLAIMYLLGFSLNNLTLMALTIATGFVVDDAIVMIENISRYIEQGEGALKAALMGAKQIGFTIISLTVSLLAVLIPLIFMSDIVGRLFREFAVTLGVCILLSAIVSLTATPMLCALLLGKTSARANKLSSRGLSAGTMDPAHKARDDDSWRREDYSCGRDFDPKREEAVTRVSKFVLLLERYFNIMAKAYEKSLGIALKHINLTLFIAVLAAALAAALLVKIPKGFFPEQDTGLIQGISEAHETISFNHMALKQQALVDVILQDEAVLNVSSYIGIDGSNVTNNSGRILIALKPLQERKLKVRDIMQRLQVAMQKVSDIHLYMQPVQDLTIDTEVSKMQYQYSISSPYANEVNAWSSILQHEFSKSKVLTDVTSNAEDHGLETFIEVDRDTMSRLGLSMQNVDDALYDAFGQRQISTIYTQQNQYRVVLDVMAKYQKTPRDLKNIYLIASNGASIPLATIAKIISRSTSLVLNHENQFPVEVLSFNLQKGYALGDAIASVRAIIAKQQLPLSLEAEFIGSANTFQDSLDNEGFLVMAAIIVVYIVLGVLYESYLHPLTILSTLPSAGLGALLALFITRNELSIIALIGIILLIGIVMKNAIMMIDFALEEERMSHKKPADAIFNACKLRFRPIMMTTFAALFGAVPLALSSGVGSELRNPLGIVIIGGLLVSQILTLYTTPAIYLGFTRLKAYLQK
jgi:multidrug efflux pump